MQRSNHNNLNSYQTENIKCNSIIPKPSTPASEQIQHHPANPTTSSLHTKDLDTVADAAAGVVTDAVVSVAGVEAKNVNGNTVGRTVCAITTNKRVTTPPTVTSRTPLWKTVWAAMIGMHDGVGW